MEFCEYANKSNCILFEDVFKDLFTNFSIVCVFVNVKYCLNTKYVSVTGYRVLGAYTNLYRERKTMSFYHKIFLNILRHKFSKYSYVLFCLLCVCYYAIYARFIQIPILDFNAKPKMDSISEWPTSKPSSTVKIPKLLLMKYILLWTSPKKYPFLYFGEGTSVFENRSCRWTNCYVTANRELLGAYTEFDVIAFNGPQLSLMIYNRDWPKERLPHQKYVFANIESAANNPFRTNVFNGFFNWTWTYKLNSDAVWGYVIVRDAENNVIGPQKDMHWLNEREMGPISKKLKLELNTKDRAAAWMCSSKDSASRREVYVNKLQEHLREYQLKVDIYGECGDHQCPKKIMARCLKNIQKHYYFYLAFENSFSDDYVTEKILHALNHNTVPIVYGGANYSRFLPPRSYLDAAALGPKKLAQTIVYLIKNPLKYTQFFRWKKYYHINPPHDSPETDSYCNFCAMINNETLMKKHTTYQQFNAWWMQNVMRVL